VPGGTGTGNEYYSAGQAFYVIANGASPSITLPRRVNYRRCTGTVGKYPPADEVTAVNSSSSNHISMPPYNCLRFNLQNDVNTEETVIAFQNGRTATMM